MPELGQLIDSWVRSMRATNLSERTITSYLLAANQLIDHQRSRGRPLEASQIDQNDIRS